jgi:RNA polymerase sigma factor (sigma-70 family)
MKKYRKLKVYIDGVKCWVDVPVDEKLYKADNHADYQWSRSKRKHKPLTENNHPDFTGDVMENYEEAQLLEHLRSALDTLTEKERLVVGYLFYAGMTERATADKLGVKQQMVNRVKRRVIDKLRNMLNDWM